jgi:kinetochore protein Mis12/MTW1
MSLQYVKSIGVLTEHFGYMPIALIDDIINAVNDILYKCTAAMEDFLSRRYGPQSNRKSRITISENEIEVGTAKLETLLESVVDRCFDKFELYVLRNLLTIPDNLISEGWIRLSHHRGVNFNSGVPLEDLADQLVSLEQTLYNETRINALLHEQLDKTTQELEFLSRVKMGLSFATSPAANQDLKDTFLFLSSQMTTMMNNVEAIQSTRLRKRLEISSRQMYLDTFSRKAIESASIPAVMERRTELEATHAGNAAGFFAGLQQ